MADLGDIITSKIRVKVLELFLANLKEMYHVRGIVRESKEEINAVRRELERLERVGFLKKEARGNRLYYWVRDDYPFYGDLIAVVAKCTGLGLSIIENKNKIGKVNFVMFSGRFARRKERSYTVMSREEYEFRKKRRDPFLLNILSGSRTMVIGDEEELIG